MGDAEIESRTAIRRAILGYLSSHPRASDALAGICAWWLPQEGVVATAAAVEEVLSALVEEQRIRRVQLPDGTRIYSAADMERRC